jgi:regulator of RNase E activity RraA
MPDKSEIDRAIEGLKEMRTAYIMDGMDRIGLTGGWLDGLVARTELKQGSYVGRVLTVQWAPTHNRGMKPTNLSRYSVNRERNDETILMYAGGLSDRFLIGDLVTTAAKVAGFEAILVDGCSRDSLDLREVGIAVFTTGIEGRYNNPLEVVAYNIPVMFRGEWVQPGALVAADSDGAMVFPADRAPEILENAEVIAEIEKEQLDAILNEAPLDVLSELLRKKHPKSSVR